MECPKCQLENREEAKFCNECGHKFQLTCPECGSINRVGSKFCDECGSNLIFPIKQTPKDLSFDEKLTKIQKYLPKGLTEKILSQRNRIEGERKQVTVMFCDMQGFTSLVEIIGPEEAYNMMDQIYEILIHKVHKYEGTVNEMTGDGVMALFGAPIAIYKDNISGYFAILANHFIHSGNYKKASEYSSRAGKIAQKAALFNEAIEYAKETIYCLERLPRNETTQKKIIDARTRLAGYYLSIDHYVDAKEAVETIVTLSLELNYEKRLPIIYIVLGSYSLWVEENFLEALQNLKKALEISEKMNDRASMWFARFFLGITLSLNCEFEKGLGYLRKALDLGTESNNPIMSTFAKSSMSTFNYIYQGKADLAYQMSQESLSTAQESGDVYLMGMAYSSCGIACFCKGLFKEAENMLLQALSFCEKITLLGWGTWGTGFLGHAYAEMGEYKTAIDTYQKGISELEQANLFPFWINVWKLSIIRLKVLDDDLDINQYEVFEYYRNIDVMAVKGWAARYVAEILLRIDKQNISKAEEWVIKALKTDKNNGTMLSIAGDYALYAKLLVQKGKPIQAKKKLDEAIKIFKACGADGWVEKYVKELTAL